MADAHEDWKRFQEARMTNGDFSAWEIDDLMSLRKLEEDEIDITDLMLRVLQAMQDDTAQVFDDVAKNSTLIVIPTKEGE